MPSEKSTDSRRTIWAIRAIIQRGSGLHCYTPKVLILAVRTLVIQARGQEDLGTLSMATIFSDPFPPKFID